MKRNIYIRKDYVIILIYFFEFVKQNKESFMRLLLLIFSILFLFNIYRYVLILQIYCCELLVYIYYTQKKRNLME